MTDLPKAMSAAQRTFVDAAEARGAVEPHHAVLLAELPRLQGRELDELLTSGLVREANDGRYYVFRARRSTAGTRWAARPEGGSARSWTTGRFLRTLIFWILLVLLPILLLQLSRVQ